MGKFEEEPIFSSPPIPENLAGNAGFRCRIGKFVSLRCVTALAFGVAVLLSAIFWLPPFLNYGKNGGDLYQDGEFGAHIMASFRLQKPVSLLNAHIMKLEYDIFEEIGVPNSMVLVSSLEPLPGTNLTNVEFGVWPYLKGSTISSAGISLLRASFLSLVIQQSNLHLTPSLFGDPSFFQVLKFPGGITVIPQQSAFLLQKVQILFNFTLNFSIHQIQVVFAELKDQLNSGLRLTRYENLYVSLTNVHGSTVTSPTIVQASVLLAVGNLPPPLSRLKQLAQAITGSPARNLGLNHTVFGKVKQIQLSSFLQHSLNTGPRSSGTSWSPSPAPLPRPDTESHHHHDHHRRRHHYHHHHESDTNRAPTPAPQRGYQVSPPSSCESHSPKRHKNRNHVLPTVGPTASPSPEPSAPPLLHLHPPSPEPSAPPLLHLHPPSPSSPSSHPILSASPLPALTFAHAHPPSMSLAPVKPLSGALPISPSPSPSSDAGFLPTTLQWFQCSFPLLLPLLINL